MTTSLYECLDQPCELSNDWKYNPSWKREKKEDFILFTRKNKYQVFQITNWKKEKDKLSLGNEKWENMGCDIVNGAMSTRY